MRQEGAKPGKEAIPAGLFHIILIKISILRITEFNVRNY